MIIERRMSFVDCGETEIPQSRHCTNRSSVITSDITLIVVFPIICTSKQKQKLAAMPHQPTGQTGMLLMHSSESVEVLITVIEL